MDKYKIKDLKERLAKETSQEHKNKMLYMWVKQEHISLQEYNSLVKNHSVLSNVMDTLNLNEAAVEKLEYIRGRGFRHHFPNQQPEQEWIGAVCDFLDETDS